MLVRANFIGDLTQHLSYIIPGTLIRALLLLALTLEGKYIGFYIFDHGEDQPYLKNSWIPPLNENVPKEKKKSIALKYSKGLPFTLRTTVLQTYTFLKVAYCTPHKAIMH